MFAASAQPFTPLTSAPRLQTPGAAHLHPSEAIYSQAARTWPCTIDPYRFQAYLEGYESLQKQFVLNGLRYGFDIQSSVPHRPANVYTNHKSALDAEPLVTIKIFNERKANRISGPYNFLPHDLLLSPLSCVPKRDSDDIRLIHDLSFPKGESVNDFIPREASFVVYELVDHCIDIICELGPGCQIAKADIKNAFRILPVHPNCYKLLGFQ